MDIVIREGMDADWGYCLATWIRSFPQIGDRETRKNHMRRALSRGRLMVACSSEEPDTLVGWALAERNDLWWTYVALDFRKLKLSAALKKAVLDDPLPSK